ncbi:MAG: MiaB/RimO family radical SAM methylthiotransferase [Eubacteriales bacterium]
MKNVALHNLGCKVNAYEIEVMQQNLQEKGYQIVPFAPGADIYIINTCTVTNIADRKSRQMLHKAKKMNPEAIVVATGCYVQTGTEEVVMDECIDLAIGNNKKKDLLPILEQFIEEQKEEHEEILKSQKTLHDTTIIDINHTSEYEEMTLTYAGEHTRAYIKVQDGCNQFCSYCIIPFARGRVRSRKQEAVINEIKGLVSRGYQEVVITGIHLSSYGIDFVSGDKGDYLEIKEENKGIKDARAIAFEKKYLLNLIKQIHQIDGLERIRLGSLEPRIITKEFATELSNMEKICPHFHLSLQSGCDATLKRMNRHYTAEEYKEKVEILRTVFDNPAITTDVIVGFPDESNEEFVETKKFLEIIRFYEMHIFKYSKRHGTVAASMVNQVQDHIKAKRSEVLLELEKEQSLSYRENYIGKTVKVLIEESKVIDGKSYQVGHTTTYIKVAISSEKDMSNQIVEGKVVGLLTNQVLFMKTN